MDKKKIGRWLLATGIMTAILGFVHIAFTPAIYASGYNLLPNDLGQGFLFVFVFTGAAVVFAGLQIIYSSFGLRKDEGWARNIAAGGGVFMLLLGIGAVYIMSDNVFAYISFVLGLMVMFPLVFYRNEINRG